APGAEQKQAGVKFNQGHHTSLGFMERPHREPPLTLERPKKAHAGKRCQPHLVRSDQMKHAFRPPESLFAADDFSHAASIGETPALCASAAKMGVIGDLGGEAAAVKV